MTGSYFLYGSILENGDLKKTQKNGRFSGRIWPDWGNTTRTDMAGFGSIGLSNLQQYYLVTIYTIMLGVTSKYRWWQLRRFGKVCKRPILICCQP